MRSTKRLSLEELVPYLWDEKPPERAAGLAPAVLNWRAIRPGGRFSIATEVAAYFALMTELCGQQPRLAMLPDAGLAHNLDYLTNFERKAREQGTPVNRAVYERR